jgi:hypothetical protein
MVSTAEKDPRYVESGRRGAAVRWADPERRRAVSLRDLSIEQRAAVLALIAAAKAEADAAPPAGQG